MTYSAEVLADSPDGFWACDDGSGAPQDTSGNAYHATLSSGSNVYVSDGLMGTVLDVESGEWTLPLALNGTAWTIEFIGYVGSAGSGSVSVSGIAPTGSGGGVQLVYDTAYHNASSGGPPTSASHSSTYGDAWRHIVGTWDGATLTVYIDGVSVGTHAFAPGALTTGSPLTLSHTGTTATYRISGVAVYPTALTGARVLAHWNTLPLSAADIIAVVAPVHVTAMAGSFGTPVSASISAEVATVDVTALAGAFGQKTRPVATPAGQAPVWSVHRATMTGSAGEIQTVDGRRAATCTRITKEINSISYSVTIPPPVAGLAPITDEVQIYRNGHLHAWGPVLPVDGSTGPGEATSYSGRDPSWYLERTVVGDPERLNFLENPSFEDGLTGWPTTGPCTAAEETAIVARGDKAMRLTGTVDEADAYAENSFVHDNTAAAYGYWFYAKAWVCVTSFTKAAKSTFGLWIRFTNGTVTREAWAPLNAATPRNQFVPLEAKVLGEAHSSGYVTVRLYAPHGSVVWDAVQVVGNNFTGGTSVEGTDQALMAAELVRVAQHDPNKSDKKIGRACPLTGKKFRGIFPHADHAWISDALNTTLTHEDGADWWVDCTPSTRTFRTAYPYRGGSAPALVFADGGNASSARVHADGSDAASAVIMQGPGDGPAREEGGAVNAAAFGGKIIDRVSQAPNGAPLSRLDQLARDELVRAEKIPTTLTFTVGGDLVDAYEPGDTCSASIDWGNVSESLALARVQTVDINPVADTADVTVTEWTAP